MLGTSSGILSFISKDSNERHAQVEEKVLGQRSHQLHLIPTRAGGTTAIKRHTVAKTQPVCQPSNPIASPPPCLSVHSASPVSIWPHRPLQSGLSDVPKPGVRHEGEPEGTMPPRTRFLVLKCELRPQARSKPSAASRSTSRPRRSTTPRTRPSCS